MPGTVRSPTKGVNSNVQDIFQLLKNWKLKEFMRYISKVFHSSGAIVRGEVNKLSRIVRMAAVLFLFQYVHATPLKHNCEAPDTLKSPVSGFIAICTTYSNRRSIAGTSIIFLAFLLAGQDTYFTSFDAQAVVRVQLDGSRVSLALRCKHTGGQGLCRVIVEYRHNGL